MQLCHIPGVAVTVDGEEHHVTAEKAGEFFAKEVEPICNVPVFHRCRRQSTTAEANVRVSSPGYQMPETTEPKSVT
jgi:hypothetical protein